MPGAVRARQSLLSGATEEPPSYLALSLESLRGIPDSHSTSGLAGNPVDSALETRPTLTATPALLSPAQGKQSP